MATVRWRGDAPAIAQVQSWAFGGTWESSDVIRVTIGGKTKDFTAGSPTTSTVVANLVAAWNALSAASWPEFAELTASQSTTTFKLTADTGKRAAMLEQAEGILLEEMPVMPIYFYVSKNLVSTRVKGWQDNLQDYEYVRNLSLSD